MKFFGGNIYLATSIMKRRNGACSRTANSPQSQVNLDVLLAQAPIKRYRKGYTVLERGDRNDSLFVVLDGYLESYVELNGVRTLVDRKRVGDYFGEISVLCDLPNPTTIATLEDSCIGIVSRSLLADYAAVRDDLLPNLVAGLGQTVSRLSERLGALALDAYGRLRLILYHLAEEHDGTFVIRGHWTHQHLAELAGCTRVTMAKMMTALKRGQWLTSDRTGIVLLKPLPESF